MKKLKIKKHVLPVLVMAICLLTVVTSAVTLNLKKENKELLHLNYVSNTIISKDQAVINTTTKVISPYVDQSVQIGKNYYDYKGTQEDQEKAIIYHENTIIKILHLFQSHFTNKHKSQKILQNHIKIFQF